MKRERYLQNETTLRHQDKAGSLLPFSPGTTLTRNQRISPIKAQLKMLRLIFFLLILLIFSCNIKQDAKHRKGDIVYLKPDSTKAVIVDINSYGALYELYIPTSFWFRDTRIYCEEEQIY